MVDLQVKTMSQNSSITLFGYQADLLEQLRHLLIAGKRRLIMCAPTGAGKTIMFSKMACNA